jgi:hypothetical protein
MQAFMHSTQQACENLAQISAHALQASAWAAQIASAYLLPRDINVRLSDAIAAQSRATAAHFSRSGSPEVPHSTEQRSQASMQRTVVFTQGATI